MEEDRFNTQRDGRNKQEIKVNWMRSSVSFFLVFNAKSRGQIEYGSRTGNSREICCTGSGMP